MRITQGCDKGGFYHELFLRDRYFLAREITRQKVKGTFIKGISNPADEPKFYEMPFVSALSVSPKDSAQPEQGDSMENKEEAIPLVDFDTFLDQVDHSDSVASSAEFSSYDEEFCISTCGWIDGTNNEIKDEVLFADICFEDDLSNSVQYFSFSEYINTCVTLQMVIDRL